MMDTSKQEKLIQQYIDRQCDAAELEAVLLLLQTDDGKAILQQKMEEAAQAVDAKQQEIAPEISVEIRNRILDTIRQRKLYVRRSAWLRVAAAVLLVLATTAVWYQFGAGIKDRILATNQKEVRIESGKIAKITLPDGTVMQVRGGSKINFAENFNGMSQRRVYLEGEAYFEVAKNAEKPFIIQTTKAQIQVVGTAFNVKESNLTDEVIVAVTEGKVFFKSKTMEEKVYLEKQQIGILNSDGTLAARSANSDNYLNWFSGRLAFDRALLTTVTQQLEHIYDVKIIISDDKLSTLTFTADMKSTRIEAVLEQISTSLSIAYHYDRNKQAYVLKQLKK